MSTKPREHTSQRPARKHRLLLGLLVVTTLVALTALPGYTAPQKIYNLDVTPSQALAGQSTDFFVTMANKTPGNSNPNSFSVTAPSGFSVTAASISAATNPNSGATITVVGSSRVDVRGLDPVKTSQYVTLKVTATTPTITACNQGGYTWTAKVWTGSNLSGDQFSLNNAGTAQQTTLVSCLSLRFAAGFVPTDGTVNEGQQVRVEVVAGSLVVTAFTGPITIELDSGPTGGTLTGNGPVTAVAGVADFPAFAATASGDYTVHAETTSTGVANSAPATFTVYDGILGCPSTTGYPNTATENGEGDAEVSVTRRENLDGTPCVPKGYILTSNDETPPGGGDTTNVVTFDQETVGGQESAHYTMDIDWTFPPGTSPSTNPATIGGETFFIDLGDGEGPREAELCPVVGYETDGSPIAGMHPADLPWCITGQSYTIDEDGNVVLTQSWDGIGDPKIFR